MPRGALAIGPCHCSTARERYRLGPSAAVLWDDQWNDPSPFLTPNLDSEPDSDSDAEVSEDHASEPPQGEGGDDEDMNMGEGQDGAGGAGEAGEEDEGDIDMEGWIEDDSDDLQNESAAFQDPADSDAGNSSFDDGVPDIAYYRLNLTALSQRYNVYAAAYGSEIHISRVRSCIDHTLPAHPDLILTPPRSTEAVTVGGYLDHNKPHQMSHMVVGDLGDEEILLLAFDDGDVLAYYTSQIETTLLYRELGDTLNSTTVEPFFHQNVGVSAWGLAIHKKSRLIAVGNNHHTVHVFAMALTDPQYTSGDARNGPLGQHLFLPIRKNADGNIQFMSETIYQALGGNTKHFGRLLSRRRQFSYRLILDTGTDGSNIPNVAFGNDSEGNAIEVLAVDILGKLWVLDIWSLSDVPSWSTEGLHVQHYRSKFQNSRRRVPNHLPRGWGVLVLPESSFLPTTSFRESLGLPPSEATYVSNSRYGYYISTREAITHLKNNSTRHPWVRQNKCHRFDILPQWESPGPLCDWYDRNADCKTEWTAAQDEAADESSEELPPNLPKRRAPVNIQRLVTDGSSVMRTYEMDIELVGGSLDNTGIMFQNAIYQWRPPRTVPPHAHFSLERLANLLHVPELSLVVAGSMCGRVVLITLTRPTNPLYSFKRGFRIEAILPKRVDEDRHLRPICPLLGVAIGPIPSAGKNSPGDRFLGERRYRIMIHYYDHRILSYEVYRNVMTSELSVI